MSMYTTAQLLAANEQKFKFDPLFLRLFFRELSLHHGESLSLTNSGLVNMALYVSPIVSGEVIRSRGGSTSEFTPGYVKPKHEVNPQMTLRRLPDEDPQNLADWLTAAVASSCRTCETKSWPLLRSKRCRQFLLCLRANTP
ncbi:major capsid protein [Escherichia coli]|uniref:major capsid protein n=1 Tax=Escherichia coli TaxID=562 RepID=UPI00388ECF94